jgi:hypothetical protein
VKFWEKQCSPVDELNRAGEFFIVGFPERLFPESQNSRFATAHTSFDPWVFWLLAKRRVQH